MPASTVARINCHGSSSRFYHCGLPPCRLAPLIVLTLLLQVSAAPMTSAWSKSDSNKSQRRRRVQRGITSSFQVRQVVTGTSQSMDAGSMRPAQMPTRVALFEGSWGMEAVAQLSATRSNVVKAWNTYMRAHKGINPALNDVGGLWGREYFKPFVSCPPGMTLQRIGSGGDGGKLVCGIATLQPPCFIYSLGSNGQYDFEVSVLNATACEVHTFDCTYDGTSQWPGRHFYHKTCMGTDRIVNGSIYLSWTSVLQHLGHKHVDLLKIDIEGFEVDFLSDWSDDVADYPQQLTLELHYSHRFEKPRRVYTLGEMALFVHHLYSLGYAMHSMEVNPDCKKCSEFSFVRVEGPPRRSAKRASQQLLHNQ